MDMAKKGKNAQTNQIFINIVYQAQSGFWMYFQLTLKRR